MQKIVKRLHKQIRIEQKTKQIIVQKLQKKLHKKLMNFDIGKVWAIRIHCQNLGNFRQIRANLDDFRKKTKNRPHFFFTKTRLKCP